MIEITLFNVHAIDTMLKNTKHDSVRALIHFFPVHIHKGTKTHALQPSCEVFQVFDGL